MKPSDNLAPYILASMHPIMHMTMLATAMIMIAHDHEKFYEVPGTLTDPAAKEFARSGSFHYMYLIMTAHLLAITFHYLYQVLNHHDRKTLANIFLVLKVGIYIYVVMVVQCGITFEKDTDKTDRSRVMAWLTYEVVVFYFNILSVVVFLFLASFKKFKTIRERLGFAGQQRKYIDFLTYCKEDIHWWQIWANQVFMFLAGLAFRSDKSIVIGLSAMQLSIIMLLGTCSIRQLYFNSKFQFKQYTKVFLGSTLLICLMMIPRYFYLREQGSVWWAPVVLEIIVAHIIIYIQMLVEYLTWDSKRDKWQKELIFMKEYKETDVSETNLRMSIQQNMALNPDSFIADEPEKKGKTLKLSANFYTATFCGLMKANKQKYKLKDDEQIEMVWRACFIYAIQFSFNLVLHWYSGMEPKFTREVNINVSLFFTVLVLHLTCLPFARDGIAMMKYALVQPNEFNHPRTAFVLGFFAMTSIVTAELVNIVAAQSKTEVTAAIAGFIGFKCIIDLPSIYMNSHEEFAIKGAVGKLEVKSSRRDKERPRIQNDWFFNSVFVMFNVFYKSIFFYFFPFATILAPMVRSLEGNVNL